MCIVLTFQSSGNGCVHGPGLSGPVLPLHAGLRVEPAEPAPEDPLPGLPVLPRPLPALGAGCIFTYARQLNRR